MVFRSNTWGTFIRTALRKCDCVRRVHLLSALGKECDHLSVAGYMLIRIIWRSNQEKWARLRRRLPPRPWLPAVDEALLDTKLAKNLLVEDQRTVEIRDGSEDV